MNTVDSTEENHAIDVRLLRDGDLDAIVRIDAQASGRLRRDYFRLRLDRALNDTSVRISLAAEIDGKVVGFLLGSVYYGDFGVPEPVATIDAIGVDTRHARHGVGRALWSQLATNLKGIQIDRVQTQVDWAQLELLTFFHKLGFKPGTRIALERALHHDRDD
ncbi:MAG: GNAT family N-acetyltransferase [Polyangiaceae bacterium]|nr:GNAT family N-acetyltransferase [Polyangiaceae bacterium]